ncbi:MAG: HAMP domain-containing sensor histidine kinase [Planctomycetota bacterium]
MKVSSPRRASWIVTLILLPLAGMIALSLIGLQATVREAERQARADARSRVQGTVRALREVMSETRLVERLPKTRRFEIDQGDLVVPPEIGALEPIPIRDPVELAPLPALRHLESARRAEFGGGEPQEALVDARAAVEAARGDTSFGGDWVRLQAAWIAQRLGAAEQAGSWRDSVDWMRESAPEIVGGMIILALVRDEEPSSELRDAFLRLPADLATSFLDSVSADSRDLRSELAGVAEIRETTQTVLAAPLDPEGTQPMIEPWAGRLLIYVPKEPGRGTGAWIEPAILAETLRRVAPPSNPLDEDRPHEEYLSPVPWEGRLVAGEPPSENALTIAPGLWLEPRRDLTPLPFWTRPIFGTAVLAALAVLIGLGLWLSSRALRRETEAARARADFLTSITHELRTPLASIRLFAEMLQDGRVSSKATERDYLELLGGEAARLSVLVENVLDLGRAARGERGYDRRPQPIGPCLEHIGAVFAPLMNRDGLELAVQIGDPEAVVAVDSEALTQAVLNVLENARRYGASGGRVVLRGRLHEGRYQIEVEDDGPGIPPEERESIFTPFTRGRESSDGRVPGLGVGLALSRTILRAHAGDLVLADTKGASGAHFVASLPLAPEEHP